MSAPETIEFRYPVNGTRRRLVGLNLGFFGFLPVPFRSYAPLMRGLFEHYLGIVPFSTFSWQNLGGNSGAYRPTTRNSQATITAWLDLKKKYGSSCAIWLQDGPSHHDAPDHQFQLFGSDDDDEGSGNASYMCVLFPASFAREDAIASVTECAHQMLASVPFHSAYLGYTLGISPLQYVSGYDDQITQHCYAMANRYQGLEMTRPEYESYEMAVRLRPPSWTTFLSNSIVDELGGRRAFERLPGSITLRTLAHGLSIQAGPLPRLADRNRGEQVASEQLRLAKLTEPKLSQEPAILFDNRDEEDTLKWYRRLIE